MKLVKVILQKKRAPLGVLFKFLKKRKNENNCKTK
jgi:hypothetical protein